MRGGGESIFQTKPYCDFYVKHLDLLFLFLFDADRICSPDRNRRNGSYICLFLDLVLVPSWSPFRSPHCSCSRLPVPCSRVCSHVPFSSCSNRVHVHVCLMFRSVLVPIMFMFTCLFNVPFSSCSCSFLVHVPSLAFS